MRGTHPILVGVLGTMSDVVAHGLHFKLKSVFVTLRLIGSMAKVICA